METKEDLSELEEFLQGNEKTHFLQSPEWQKVKTKWKNEFIIIKDTNNKIVGTMSILIRKVPIFNKTIMYAPRGFVCDINDRETLEKLTNKVIELAKKHHAFIFRMDPDVSESNEQFKSILKELGYKFKKHIKSIDDVIQPKYVMRMDLSEKTEEDLLNSFQSKTRYNIRLSSKKGVQVREGTKADLKTFYNILKNTGKRDNFFVRDFSYFEKIYDIMYPKYTKLFIAEYNNIPIAATMPILYGNKVWYLYGGSSNEYRNLMPNYLIQWEMIKWALQNKCTMYDFRGVSGFQDVNSPQYGVYRFKKGFNGEVVEFIDEPYIVFNHTFNTIWNIILLCYQKLSCMKIKIVKGIENLGK